MHPCTKQGSLAVQLNHYKDFKPWFVAVPSLIFCFSNNSTFCTCSNMMSTLLPPNCVQNIFKSPETQISIYKSIQLPRSLKPQAAPSGFFKVSHPFYWEALLKNQPRLLSSLQAETFRSLLLILIMTEKWKVMNWSGFWWSMMFLQVTFQTCLWRELWKPFSKHQQISLTIN